MNKVRARQLFAKMFAGLKDVYFHPDLLNDIESLIFGSGRENEFFSLLLAHITLLCEQKLSLIRSSHKSFEALIGIGLYSMHLQKRDFNIRMIFSFSDHNEIVLLHAFYERSGKRKTEYSAHIPISQERLKQMTEG